MADHPTQLNFKNIPESVKTRVLRLQKELSEAEGEQLSLSETLIRLLDTLDAANFLQPAESFPLAGETLRVQRHLESVAALFHDAGRRLEESETHWAGQVQAKEEKISALNEELERLRRELEELKAGRETLEASFKQEIEALTARLKETESRARTSSEEAEVLRQALQERGGWQETALARQRELEKERERLEGALSKALEDAGSRQEELEEALREAGEQRLALERRAAEAEQAAAVAAERIAGLEREVSRVEVLERRIEEYRDLLRSQSEEIARLAERVSENRRPFSVEDPDKTAESG